MAKIVFAVLLGLALASTTFNVGPITQSQVEDINANSSWTASNEFLEGKTAEEISALTGTHIVPNPFPKKSFGALADFVSTPTSFDSRTQWPGCVHSVMNQQQCGSCRVKTTILPVNLMEVTAVTILIITGMTTVQHVTACLNEQ